MTNPPAKCAPINQAAMDAPKVRQCLRCRATFHSAWVGERVWSYEAGSGEAARQHVHAGPLCWTSEGSSGMRIETLNVRSRTIDPTLSARVLDAAIRRDPAE